MLNIRFNTRKFVTGILFFSFFYGYLALGAVPSAVPEELRQSIEQKSLELRQVSEQIQETQGKIEEARGQERTLKSEVSRLDYSVSQLNLSVRSSEINIDKLSLEIESAGYDIDDAEDKIGQNKQAVAQLLRAMQQKDDENLLMALLKNQSLTEMFSEVQAIGDLNKSLAVEIQELKQSREKLKATLEIAKDKKSELELERNNLKYRQSIVTEQKKERQALLAQTKNQEKLYQNLVKDLEEKQAKIAEEIEKIEEALRLTIDPTLLPTPRPGVLAMPVEGVLTQNFGDTPFARAGGYRGKVHNGVDIRASIGTPVFAAEDGKVFAIGDQDQYLTGGKKLCYRGAYGKFIVIEHENNLTTLYAHLSRRVIQEGDLVKRGDLIGYTGMTGYATGPHLHFTVYGTPVLMKQSRVCGPMPFGGYLNPLDYML